jgi:uncharacterized protein (DUF2336 family)
MTLPRPLALLRFAVEAHDVPLATALARALGPAADRELRAMARIRPCRVDRGLLSAAIDIVAST